MGSTIYNVVFYAFVLLFIVHFAIKFSKLCVDPQQQYDSIFDQRQKRHGFNLLSSVLF